MSSHPYLRAYMAGITFPTMMLLILMTAFIVARHVYDIPVPLERIIVFPMAIVPNFWGIWNVLYVARHGRRRLPIGLHGAVLPFLIAPIAWAITRMVGFDIPAPIAEAFPYFFPAPVAAHYLIWRHLVGFLNELLGIG